MPLGILYGRLGGINFLFKCNWIWKKILNKVSTDSERAHCYKSNQITNNYAGVDFYLKIFSPYMLYPWSLASVVIIIIPVETFLI